MLSVLQRAQGNTITCIVFPGPTRRPQHPTGNLGNSWYHTLMLDPHIISWPSRGWNLQQHGQLLGLLSYDISIRQVGWYLRDGFSFPSGTVARAWGMEHLLIHPICLRRSAPQSCARHCLYAGPLRTMHPSLSCSCFWFFCFFFWLHVVDILLPGAVVKGDFLELTWNWPDHEGLVQFF